MERAQVKNNYNPEGDGDCQFYAISNQLTTVGVYQNAASLRENAITHLEKHRYYYKDFVQGDMYQNLESMRQPAIYGDHLTRVALSRELNCNFLILNSEGIDNTRLVSNNGEYAEDIACYFGYFPENIGEQNVSLDLE
ncbi:hypothetical protein DPMN_069862 [Dreissena polymorpha]|uniref:OTU domain-containing protein n=1 Tax=Dreissena polymorpha TaxID=45954 RepID=A0A9D3Z552_DREPO|nr:hypothetical protein DPMN_069862 [Dreissena polymorpha]